MTAKHCPCLSGDGYGGCCGRYHRGEAAAPTAERLMRSRYSAYALGDVDYLLRTWHPSTRPDSLELDPELRWFRLDIVGSTRGGMLNTEGTVEFSAHYRTDDAGVRCVGQQRENSSFVKEDGHWLYLDALPSSPKV